MEHDQIKILQISQVTHASIAQRGEHQIQVVEVPGPILTGVTFCFWIFLFSRSKVSDANIAIKVAIHTSDVW